MNNWIEKNILSGKRPYIIIIGLAFLVYLPILFFRFTYLDDNNLILDHAGFLSHFLNIFESFRQDVFLSFSDAYYRPIMTISLILNAQIRGTSPFIYHFTDIFIHILASCLVFTLFRKLGHKKELSLFFSLIFAVHPVLSQAVSWIPGRNDTLLAVFVLANFIYFLNYLENKTRKNLFLYFLFFALAIFTKETALMIPIIQLFYLQFIFKEKFFSGNKKILLWLIPIIGLFFILRHIAFQNPIEMPLKTLLKSVFINSPAVVQLIGKIIFPLNLSVLPIIQDTTFIYGIIAIILIIIFMMIFKIERKNYFLFGALWFFLFLLPSFIRPNTEVVADFIEHRLYLPIIGFFILLVEINLFKKINFQKKYILVVLSGIILLFSVMMIIHSQNFKNRLAFWENARKNSPHSPLAHRNLGAMYFLDGKIDEAEPEFKKSLELNPKEQMAHNNLGLIYFKRGDFEKAEEEYDKELENNPFYDNAYFNKGLLYYKTGKENEAIELWEKTLEINPNYADAVYGLFGYYYQKQDKENSLFWANEAQKKGIPLLPEMQKLLNPFNAIINK